MNIINKLTLRQLKLNKRRTTVTVVGAIISVAMVMAVLIIGNSFIDLFQRQTIATNGNWHVKYPNVNAEQVDYLKQDDETSALLLRRYAGDVKLSGDASDEKPMFYLNQYNTDALENYPIKVLEGRLPKSTDEVIVSSELIRTDGGTYQIGDTVSLDIYEPRTPAQVEASGIPSEKLYTKEFTIVGFMDFPTWFHSWSAIYMMITLMDEASISIEGPVEAFVAVRHIDRSIYEHAEQVSQALVDRGGYMTESTDFHSTLLRYYGVTDFNELFKVMYGLVAIIMGIIMIGSISLIFNAFAISVSERSRHLGMLSSIGATRKQKRNSVFFEGAVIGAISIPLGIVGGMLGMGVTFYFINNAIKDVLGVSEGLVVTVTPISIAIACLVSMITIFISAYIPARRASKVTAIDAIRQTMDIKLTGKQIKTSKLVRKWFGIEAEIGLKNLKRNKRRYQVTVFSLVISILLFLSVSYFTDTLKSSLDLTRTHENYDLQIMLGSDQKFNDDMIKSIQKLPSVMDHSVVQKLNGSTWVDADQLPAPLKARVQENPELLTDGKYRYQLEVYALGEKELGEVAKQAGVEVKLLQDPTSPQAILLNKITYIADGKFTDMRPIEAKLGDSIPVLMDSAEEPFDLGSLSIAGFIEERPMGVRNGMLEELHIIVSLQQLETLKAKSEVEFYTSATMYLLSDDPAGTETEIMEIGKGNNNDYYVYNQYNTLQRDRQMLLLIQVFVYGFIGLITAISVANIFNTISTSISLRKREFAMLRSMGMTPKAFNRMINYESIIYGVKALLYGLPLSIAAMYLIYRTVNGVFNFSFQLPWGSLLIVIVAVFLIVSTAMLYAGSKVKKENIIDALKMENI